MTLAHKRLLLILMVLLGMLTLATVGRHHLQPDQAAVLLPELPPGVINRIEIQHRGVEPIGILVQDGHWMLTEPALSELRPARVGEMRDIAAAESLADYSAAEANLPALGLAPPHLILSLNGRAIAFGDRAPVGGHRYVQLGDRIHLIQDRHHHSANQPLAELVSPKLIPTTVAVQRITLGSDDERQTPLPVELWAHAEAVAVQPLSAGARNRATIDVETDGGTMKLAWQTQDDPPLSVIARPELGVQYHFAAEQLHQLIPASAMVP
jgi:hypothetical protein